MSTSAESRNVQGFVAWATLTFQSSVLDDVWGQVVTITAWTTLWVTLHELDIVNASCDSSLLGILAALLGFVVSLRTSSAYDRYCEGRRCWSGVFNDTRVLAQLVMFHVKDAVPDPSLPPREEMNEEQRQKLEMNRLQIMLEKKSFLNLLYAFSVALKHYCRDENGPYYDDLFPLINHLPKYAHNAEQSELLPLWQSHRAGKAYTPSFADHGSQRTAMSSTAAFSEASTTDLNKSAEATVAFDTHITERPQKLRRATTTLELMPSRMPPKKGITDHIPVLGWIKSIFVVCFTRPRNKAKDVEQALIEEKSRFESNTAVEIVLFLSQWVASTDRRGLCDAIQLSNLLASTYKLNDCITSFERLISTPLPWAYKIHLRLTVWLFLLTANFQVVSLLHWVTIPGMAILSLGYLGFLEIGQEIENPFDYGKNDLDLDLFCALISKELAEVTSHGNMTQPSYMMSNSNKPFETCGDNRTAAEILEHCKSEGPDTIKSVRKSVACHFRYAAQFAALSTTKHYRKQQKRAPRTRVTVDHAD